MKRLRVLVVQVTLQPPGGGNGVTAWILEALRGRYDLSVLSWTPVEWREINRFYGTSLADGDVAAEHVGVPWRRALDRLPTALAVGSMWS